MGKRIIFLGLIAFCAGCVNQKLYAQPGFLDNTFGVGGKAITDLGNDDYGMSLAIQSDGKIVVAGRKGDFPNNDFALIRYEPNGSLDSTFDHDGIALTDFGGTNDEGWSVALQNDGKIIVAGFSGNSSNEYAALARYNTDGSLDSTFGSNGKVISNATGNNCQGYSVLIQNDNKIVLAGNSGNGTYYSVFALFRFNPNGSLDSTFSVDGEVTTDFSGTGNEVRSVSIQSDNKIIVAGTNYGGNTDFAIARYNTDGSLDSTFDSDGLVTTDFGNTDNAFSVAIQSDGKIIVGGHSFTGSKYGFSIARYNINGSLDNSFNASGKTTTTFGTFGSEGRSLVVQTDGKILVAGLTSNGSSNEDFALVRYNSDGSLDSAFGLGGKIITDIGGSYDVANAIALQNNGKIIVCGNSYNGSNYDFSVARYDNNIFTGVKQTETPNESSIYPNPGSGVFNIKIDSRQNSEIRVYDVFGRCVLNQECINKNTNQINLTDEPKGIYFVEVLTTHDSQVRKIILQ